MNVPVLHNLVILTFDQTLDISLLNQVNINYLLQTKFPSDSSHFLLSPLNMAYDSFFLTIQPSPPRAQTFYTEVINVIKLLENKISPTLNGLSSHSFKIVNRCHSTLLISLFSICFSLSYFPSLESMAVLS